MLQGINSRESMEISTGKIRTFGEKLSNFSIVVFSFSLLYSTAITNIMVAGILIGYLLNFKNILNYKSTKYIILITSLILLSSLYTVADSKEITHEVHKMMKWILVPILFSSLSFNEKLRSRCVKAFLLSVTVILFLAALKIFGIIPNVDQCFLGLCLKANGRDAFFTTSIYTSALVTYYGYIMMYIFKNSKNIHYKIISGLLFLCSLIYIYALSKNRTAYIAFSFLLLCGLYLLKVDYKKIILTVTLLCVSIFFANNEMLNQRINETIHNFKKFYSEGDQTTSVGERLLYYQEGIKAWRDSPILGYGVGSIKSIYVENANIELRNVHNQYLSIMLQFGIVGIVLLLFGYLKLVSLKKFLTPEYQYALIGVISLFTIGNIFNTWFTDFVTQYFLILALSVIFANYKGKYHAT